MCFSYQYIINFVFLFQVCKSYSTLFFVPWCLCYILLFLSFLLLLFTPLLVWKCFRENCTNRVIIKLQVRFHRVSILKKLFKFLYLEILEIIFVHVAYLTNLSNMGKTINPNSESQEDTMWLRFSIQNSVFCICHN